MPMDRAILWNPPAAPGATSPGGKSTSRSPYPIFFQQEAVIALQEHLKSSPTQAIFGFLIGDVYRDPENGALYTIIDKTLKLSQPIYGDKTEVVVSRLWDRMQEQLKKAAGTLLGWYHSHPGQGGFLTAHDVETHDKFFTDPWQVAILVAAEAGGVTGRFFRATQGNTDWHKTPLAFYELLQPDSIKPDGKKRSFITWRNYKPYGPTLTGPKPKSPEPPKPPPPPPARSSDDIPWQVSPAEVGARLPEPPLPPSRLVPSGPLRGPPSGPRRTAAPAFRLLDEEEERRAAPAAKPKRRKRRGPWLKRLAILLVLAGVGAGGYWYLAIRNPTLLPGLLDRAKQLASRITKRSPARPPAAPRRRTTAGSPPAAPPAAPPP